jgi:hypothetical protein
MEEQPNTDPELAHEDVELRRAFKLSEALVSEETPKLFSDQLKTGIKRRILIRSFSIRALL